MSLIEKIVSRSEASTPPNDKPAVPDSSRTPLARRKERPGPGMNSAFFADIIATITDRGRDLFGLRPAQAPDEAGRADGLIELCETLLGGRGEASGTALAQQVLESYEALVRDEQRLFFEALAERFGPDESLLEAAVEEWRESRSETAATELHFASEPKRQELFRRLNRAPQGTRALVNLRADLLRLARDNPDLRRVDRDLAHLFSSWFNRGFLVLRRIDWSTPASVLEKIIRYEAVHEIHGWDDLRRRIDAPDRRCYAFFHPALIDEPLIFVEIALTEAMPGAIAPLLAEDRHIIDPANARTAVFYSISNCQAGLAGISFGNFLIKQVVEELQRELPKLQTFVTLSPVPGLRFWMKAADDVPVSDEESTMLAALDEWNWTDNPVAAEYVRRVLEPLATHYFLKVKTPDGRPIDPVARFHLGNGARLERINWLGDTSRKGLRESAGIMVNYLYDLDEIEENHEAYANQREVVASAPVRKLLKPESKQRLPRPASVPNHPA
ncbi:MAG: malonyl-CoA decarboxylase [Methylobacteriaceae bacterium]|jgi:malonyl-CoA decarboxylase|nr:malonyl-CoA decarboxylase [Methylobacteriaceae bacterium]